MSNDSDCDKSDQPKVRIPSQRKQPILEPSKLNGAHVNPTTKIQISQNNKSNFQNKPHPKNPYDKVGNYSHEATTIPPYVLYKIANSQRTFPNNDSTNRRNLNSLNDPFMNSINNNWNSFFKTVDSTPAFSQKILNHDAEALGQLPDLSGSWGGDERLKHYLNNDISPTDSSLSQDNKTWYQKSASSAKSFFNNGKKSGAYWMSVYHKEERGEYLNRLLLTNNFVPLFLRIFIIILSIIALVLAVQIFKRSNQKVQLLSFGSNVVPQQPSTIMAICVQSFAIIYLLYISYDEFNSKPLGIRNPVEKLRLISLDLLFIIFSSANLSISFNTLYDPRWICINDEYSLYPKITSLCRMQKALASSLFVILVMWVATFTISMMRVIHKVSGNRAGSELLN
ncbi:hypothetical protein WICMUC_002324 [Wickerhamomyces mucosus]|uniref:Regulator of phospholipase D SRF1 n=1 Tax=Wickerhamomyces mucosus TaxID=1378264 RepID=A0A9P8PPR3_9ASCO|nr:hypothetical protein WICMUC_002324 [Wickerhamomyces mucosus]